MKQEDKITMSQLDELMDSLYNYLYEHNRKLLKKKNGVNCLVDVSEFKTLVEDHKNLYWYDTRNS